MGDSVELEPAVMEGRVKKEEAQMTMNLNQLKNAQSEIWERLVGLESGKGAVSWGCIYLGDLVGHS